jgi:hypothetical protein
MVSNQAMIFLIALQLAYLVTLLSACTFAMLRGGRDEQHGAMIMLGGSLLSGLAVAIQPHWRSMQTGVLIVDLGVLAALFTLALRSDRYWPLWITAFQLIGVATHLARLADPGIIPRAYSIAQGFWAYPMLAVLSLGVRESRIAAMRRAARF